MRDVPFEFSEGCSTLCRVFVLTLASGARFGFSDHDRVFEFDGLTCAPMDATDTESQLGFASDSGALRTLFAVDLTGPDIRGGALDDARLDEFRVDWKRPSDFVQIARGRIGPVRYNDAGFEADWLGLSTLLNRSTGRVFARRCDAEFGDERCGLNAANFPDGTTCPRTLTACRDQFSNTRNYRGFPYLVGDDVLQSGLHLTPTRDGGSRYE